MKHVLCFGDSNTWGFIPGTCKRYDEHTRWTGILQDELGADWRIHENGQNGRTTVFPEPSKNFMIRAISGPPSDSYFNDEGSPKA